MTVITGDSRNGSEPLGRLLSHEANVADLLAYLIELDAAPLLGALGLLADDPGIRQEVSKGRSGRFDAFIMDDGRPIALIELKVGATQHGDQFARYDTWAAENGKVPCFLVSLDKETPAAPKHWGQHLLPDLLAGWARSPSETARVLALAMERALRDVLNQTALPLGDAKRTAVAIAFRHLDYQVYQRISDPDLCGGARRTSGGQPSLMLFERHPRALSGQEWLCVDLRSEADRSSPWKLRLGVEVDPIEDEEGRADEASVSFARIRAHDLAVSMRGALRTSSFATHLRRVGHQDIADLFMMKTDDGLLHLRDEDALLQWRVAAESGDLAKGRGKLQRHPLFNHDKGLRLVSLSYLDYQQSTVVQLTTLVTEALAYLKQAAAQQ